MPFYEYKGVRFQIDVEPVWRHSEGTDHLLGHMGVVRRANSLGKHGFVPGPDGRPLLGTAEGILEASRAFIRENWDKYADAKLEVGTRVRDASSQRDGVIVPDCGSVDPHHSWVMFGDGVREQVPDDQLSAL